MHVVQVVPVTYIALVSDFVDQIVWPETKNVRSLVEITIGQTCAVA